jgi:hypothetical protein
MIRLEPWIDTAFAFEKLITEFAAPTMRGAHSAPPIAVMTLPAVPT